MNQLITVIILFLIIEAISYFYQKQLDKIWFLRIFLWIGIFIHEFSHYLMCKLTLAPVTEFRVGLRQGHVTHGKSKIPIVGSFLISLAPLFIGFILLMLLFYFITGLTIGDIKVIVTSNLWPNFVHLIKSLPYQTWQFWFYLFLMLNILATFVPSKQDFKNIAGLLILYGVISILISGILALNLILSYALAFLLGLLVIALIFLLLIATIKRLLRFKS